MEDGIETPPVVQPIVTPVEQASSDLVEPVVDIASRVGTIEERQKNHELELIRQISELESRMSTASAGAIEGIHARISELEGKLASVEEKAVEVPVEAATATLDAVDMPSAPREKRKGIHARRKSRRSE